MCRNYICNIVFLLLFSSSYSYADHIFGGDMTYRYIGENTYEFNMTVYRDCASDGADFDLFADFSVYANTGGFIGNFPDTLDEETIQRVPFSELYSLPCTVLTTDTCIEYTVYSSIIYLEPIIGGYTVAYQRCCTPFAINVNPDGEEFDAIGFTNSCQIPGLETGAYENVSPEFLMHSPFVVCNNTLTSFDHSAFDEDGDSLSYSLIDPIKGGSYFDVAPSPAAPPPYESIDWVPGFDALNPLGISGTIDINETTGVLDIDPTIPGKYFFAIMVKEYRAGELISERIRNLILNVIDNPVDDSGLFEETSNNDFVLYPNPVINSFSIKTKKELNHVLIYDLCGNLLKQTEHTTNIDVQEFRTGIYYIIIVTEDNYYYIKKIQKQ